MSSQVSLQEGGRGRFDTEGKEVLMQDATLLSWKMDQGTKKYGFRSCTRQGN